MQARSPLLLTSTSIGILFLLIASIPCASQKGTTRLVLKDGSYQVITKYEVQGDRVHYYSAERSEWEDVPNSMVDWDATRQYEQDRATGKMSPEAMRLEQELEAERQEDEAKSPTVAPGLRLPPEGGVYALDTYLAEPELLPLDQIGGDINRHTAHNVLRGVVNPVAGAKHTIELPGPRAKLQVHALLPTIYVNLDTEDEQDDTSKQPAAELPWDRFRIVRAQVKGDKRVVGEIKVAVYGKASQQEEVIPAAAEQMGQGWIKITPKAQLAPGEYALAEMLGKQGMNSYVWEFGVHPDAPANLTVIKPEKPAAAPASASSDVEKLKKRN
jgi:hypothetical protein